MQAAALSSMMSPAGSMLASQLSANSESNLAGWQPLPQPAFARGPTLTARSLTCLASPMTCLSGTPVMHARPSVAKACKPRSMEVLTGRAHGCTVQETESSGFVQDMASASELKRIIEGLPLETSAVAGVEWRLGQLDPPQFSALLTELARDNHAFR